MEKPYTTDDIEEYLHGRMGETERKALEAQMVKDQELAKEVRFFQNLKDASQNLAEKELAAAVARVDVSLEKDGFFKESEKKTSSTTTIEAGRPRTFVMRRLLSRAAAILILFVAGVAWWGNQRYSDTAIAEQFFIYEMPAPSRSTSGVESTMADGQQAFAEGRLGESQEAFEAIPEGSQQFVEARFYLGQVFFRLEAFSQAARTFEEVKDSNDIRFRDEAGWMQALSLLAAGEEEGAKSLLKAWANDPSHAYSEKAQKLLKKQNSFWRLLVF